MTYYPVRCVSIVEAGHDTKGAKRDKEMKRFFEVFFSFWARRFKRWPIFTTLFVVFVGMIGINSVEGYIKTRPPYYKVTVEFESQGQKATLFAVVKCVGYFRKPFGSSTGGVEYFPEPVSYGLRLPDNSGVLMTVGVGIGCREAYTARRQGVSFSITGVPRLMWVHDFDKRDEVELYLGQFAYNQPTAKVVYSSAKLEPATSGEYRKWLEAVKDDKNSFLDMPVQNELRLMNPMLHSVLAHNSLYAIEVPRELWKDDPKVTNWITEQTGSGIINLPDDLAYSLRGRSWSLRPDPAFWPHLLSPRAGRKTEHNPEYVLPLLTPLARTSQGYEFDEKRRGILLYYHNPFPREGQRVSATIMGQPIIFGGDFSVPDRRSRTFYDAQNNGIYVIHEGSTFW